jgi:hypothetical protein
MKFQKDKLSIICILGIILLYSYYYFISLSPRNLEILWAGIKGSFKKIYMISIFLAAFGFLLLLYYLFITDSLTETQINKLFLGTILVIIISMLWMPLTLKYSENKSKTYQFMVLIVLFSVVFSSLYIISIIDNIDDKKNKKELKLTRFGMYYFLFHTFILDSLAWSFNFFY